MAPGITVIPIVLWPVFQQDCVKVAFGFHFSDAILLLTGTISSSKVPMLFFFLNKITFNFITVLNCKIERPYGVFPYILHPVSPTVYSLYYCAMFGTTE